MEMPESLDQNYPNFDEILRAYSLRPTVLYRRPGMETLLRAWLRALRARIKKLASSTCSTWTREFRARGMKTCLLRAIWLTEGKLACGGLNFWPNDNPSYGGQLTKKSLTVREVHFRLSADQLYCHSWSPDVYISLTPPPPITADPLTADLGRWRLPSQFQPCIPSILIYRCIFVVSLT